MILSDRTIKKLAEEGMVTPFDEQLVNPCSLDIRVGFNAKVLVVDWRGEFVFKDVDLWDYKKDLPYQLKPNTRMLLGSMETFNIPNDICGIFYLKSSRAREFYEHLHAGFIDAGWHGSVLTMELINLNYKPLPIYPGLRIGQIVFQRLENPPEKDYSRTGRYNNDASVQDSKG